MNIPSEYTFRPELRTTLSEFNFPLQMSYSKKCTLSDVWNIFYCNLLDFLKDQKKEFYLFNDALWYSGSSRAQNRYFEFFCELGYILHKLYENKQGNQVYVVLPNTRPLVIIDHIQFESKKINNKVLPEFKILNTIYDHNYDQILK